MARGVARGLCDRGRQSSSGFGRVAEDLNPATQTVGKPLTITAAGVADGSHRLYAYADESRSTCAPNPHAEYSERSSTVALSGADGEALPAGSFSKTYTYTPTIQLPVICAYLDDTPYDTPDVSATVRDPVNEYLENREQAQSTGTATGTVPGALEPLPANQQLTREYWERVGREARMREEGERKASEEAKRKAQGQSVSCVVPSLRGQSLNGARTALRRAHCKLGKVSTRRGALGALVVIQQSRTHGTRLRRGAAVAVTLGLHRL